MPSPEDFGLGPLKRRNPIEFLEASVSLLDEAVLRLLEAGDRSMAKQVLGQAILVDDYVQRLKGKADEC